MTISLERLVIAVLEELSLEYSPGGSVTLKRAEMSAEKELHFCYYIQNEARVRGKKEIDLTQDPPPDLAVEIGMTSSSLNQLALYADLGGSEVWRANEQRLQIYQLQQGQYIECAVSPTFPILLATKVEEFLEQCQTLGTIAAVRQFREWVRNQQQQNPESGRSQR